MNDFFIYLKVPQYLKDYLENHLGDPVKLPKDSPESILVKRFLQKKSDAPEPDLGEGCNLRVQIPWSKEKDPRIYQYLPPVAKQCLISSFDDILVTNMWNDLMPLIDSRCTLTNLIYAWMEQHGIDEDHWETIRQRFYRLRKKYMKTGIKL